VFNFALNRKRKLKVALRVRECRAQRASRNAHHCDRSEIRAACRKTNRRAARGNVERTGDQGAKGKTQRTPIDRNGAGNIGVVRYLDDSPELVADYFLDHFPRRQDGYFGVVETDGLQFLDDIMQFILVVKKATASRLGWPDRPSHTACPCDKLSPCDTISCEGNGKAP
jgi:hypothetical protein